MESFQGKSKLQIFMTIKPTLQKVSEEILQNEEKTKYNDEVTRKTKIMLE